jgi:hypothetical protein
MTSTGSLDVPGGSAEDERHLRIVALRAPHTHVPARGSETAAGAE